MQEHILYVISVLPLISSEILIFHTCSQCFFSEAFHCGSDLCFQPAIESSSALHVSGYH